MKQCDGIWFPDYEEHLVMMLKQAPKVDGKGTYQKHKLDAAMKHVKNKRVALDVGMHVGLWAMHLAKQFELVIGFEPCAEHVECLRRNMDGIGHYHLHQCALGNHNGEVGLQNVMPGASGSTQTNDQGQGVTMRKLDDFLFEHVDFIKIDVEGYEYFVIEGGEQTIKKHKPVIVLEQKPLKIKKLNYGKQQHDAKKLLESWGARELFVMSGDHCMSWR